MLNCYDKNYLLLLVSNATLIHAVKFMQVTGESSNMQNTIMKTAFKEIHLPDG